MNLCYPLTPSPHFDSSIVFLFGWHVFMGSTLSMFIHSSSPLDWYTWLTLASNVQQNILLWRVWIQCN
jgi:hypothetical protein